MAQVIGTKAYVSKIVGLFKVCLDAFKLLFVAKHANRDLKRLIIRLNIEKAGSYI